MHEYHKEEAVKIHIKNMRTKQKGNNNSGGAHLARYARSSPKKIENNKNASHNEEQRQEVFSTPTDFN